MSGIFGFTYRSADETIIEQSKGGLEYWNRMYGKDASEVRTMDGSCIGCNIEHFADAFPYGGPILEFRGCPAVVDALLFNRDELTASVGLREDSGISDEELLLKLIDEKGFRALASVNGDFAGAIFDPAAQEWTLFRDHMGVRSLYYYRDEHRFAFSTDLCGIASLPGADTSFNDKLLYMHVLGINRLNNDQTDFAHIHCITPGCVCTFRPDHSGFSRRDQRYWQARQKKIRMHSDEAYRHEMTRLVTDAVHRRCDAIPGLLGAELSGGLDSGVIDILINRYGRDAVYYSWSSDPDKLPLQSGDDERKVILDICEQENIRCRFLSREEWINNEYLLEHVMPPYVNTLQITYGSRWMKSQGANVVFTGHGGDEGVSHRCSRFELLYNREFLAYLKLYWGDTKGRSLRILRTLNRAVREGWARWKYLNPKATYEDLHPIVFAKEFSDDMARIVKIRPLPFRFAPYLYVRQGGSRTRLENCVYQGAFCGVRYLFPYIDHRVMDFAVSIPRRLYLNRETSRLIFRESFADIMPDSLSKMNYKDMASLRNIDRTTAVNSSFHRRVEYLLQKLDPEVWSGVLDFDNIRSLRSDQIRNDIDEGRLTLLMSRLERCIFIQNIQKEAGRWRDRDE